MACRATTETQIFYQGHWISESKLAQKSQAELQGRLQKLNKLALRKQQKNLPPNYQQTFSSSPVEMLKVAVLVGGVALIAFITLKYLSKVDFDSLLTQGENFFKTLKISYLAVGIGVLTVWIAGTALVIHQAIHKDESLLGGSRGAFFNLRPHIQTAYLGEKDGGGLHVESQSYIDLSTLDDEGSGKAYIYSYKEPVDHYFVSGTVFLATPVYVVGAVAYNIVRTFVVPFYVLFRCAQDLCSTNSDQSGQQKFTVADAFSESAWSIWRAARAPFYGTAYMFAALYSFINPMGGRKLGSCIERNWNDGVYLSEGYWSVGGEMPLYEWEGGGGPGTLGKTGFFLAGCWQPTARATYKNGKLTQCESIERCLDRKGLRNKKGEKWCKYRALTEHQVQEAEAIKKILDPKE